MHTVDFCLECGLHGLRPLDLKILTLVIGECSQQMSERVFCWLTPLAEEAFLKMKDLIWTSERPYTELRRTILGKRLELQTKPPRKRKPMGDPRI